MFFCILGTKITDVSRKDTKKRVYVQMFKCQKIDFLYQIIERLSFIEAGKSLLNGFFYFYLSWINLCFFNDYIWEVDILSILRELWMSAEFYCMQTLLSPFRGGTSVRVLGVVLCLLRCVLVFVRWLICSLGLWRTLRGREGQVYKKSYALALREGG